MKTLNTSAPGNPSLRGIAFTLTAATVAACLSISAYAVQVCPANIGPLTTPTSAFTVNGDGTLTHTTTGLMWTQCNVGLAGAACASPASVGAPTSFDWLAALTAAQNSTIGGYLDWRLPNLKELQSVIELNCANFAINQTVFPGTITSTGRTWSSTTLATITQNAWFVDFFDGTLDAVVKGSGYPIRLVRGGYSFDSLIPILNIDNSNVATQYKAGSDGVLLLRYLLGFRGSAFSTGALGIAGAQPLRTDAQIEAHITTYMSRFDVDGDGQVLAMTDGLMIVRRLLGLSGAALTTGAKQSARSDADIATVIDALKPL